MDFITEVRALGKKLQEDERYKAYHLAKAANDEDEMLQNLIGEFNLTRNDLNNEMNKEEKDAERIAQLDTKMKEIYNQVMANENMKAFNDAKKAMDELMNQINTILTYAANGDDPEAIDLEAACSGNCSGCAGCH